MKYSKGKVACSERVEYLFHPIDLATRIWECLQAVLRHGLVRRQSISLLYQYGNYVDQLNLFYDYWVPTLIHLEYSLLIIPTLELLHIQGSIYPIDYHSSIQHNSGWFPFHKTGLTQKAIKPFQWYIYLANSIFESHQLEWNHKRIAPQVWLKIPHPTKGNVKLELENTILLATRHPIQEDILPELSINTCCQAVRKIWAFVVVQEQADSKNDLSRETAWSGFAQKTSLYVARKSWIFC